MILLAIVVGAGFKPAPTEMVRNNDEIKISISLYQNPTPNP